MERFTGWTGYHTYDPRGSVSKGVANAVDMISENVSHAVKNKVKDLMEAAVKASVMIVCSDTVHLLNDIGNAIFSFIVGTVYGALEPASVLLDFLIDSGGYDRAAFELGRIVGNAAAIAAIFGMFFAGGGAISGAFMGGAMALTLGAAGAATVEIAAGATVVAAKGNSIAEALNSLISEMSGASNSGGKGTEEEGEAKPTPEELAEMVPDKYKENFKCDQFANEMEKLMKESGVSGEKISVQSKTDYIWSDKNGVISENGKHYAIKVGDTVFDNLNPQGISYSDWLADLGISDLPSMFDVTTSLIN